MASSLKHRKIQKVRKNVRHFQKKINSKDHLKKNKRIMKKLAGVLESFLRHQGVMKSMGVRIVFY